MPVVVPLLTNDGLVAPLTRPDVGPPRVPVDDLLREGGLRCVYRPFVDLDTRAVVAHEALLRGPAGSAWESPRVLLDAARADGRLADLERCSLRASLAHVAQASRGTPVTIFVKVEPETLTQRPEVILAAVADRAADIRVVVAVTAHDLANDLAGVLRGAELLRAAGCAIALDVRPESLTFVPLVRPEVVRLNLDLLRTVGEGTTLTIAGAVRAYAEVSGAEVVVEGIGTEDDLTHALILGASLGQGPLWGPSTPAVGPARSDPRRFEARATRPTACTTPFELAGDAKGVRRAPKRMLVPISRTLELMALDLRVPPVLVAGFERARFFGPATARRYAELAHRLAFVCAFGVDMPRTPAPGVRGQPLSPTDPLTREWTVVVLGAHRAAALVARDVGSQGDDGDREFDFVVTYDRAVVIAAAQCLVGRIAPR
jgi:EAL domain-containing protein (putative c-di-GMP-specific phosphodiesterase class I)